MAFGPKRRTSLGAGSASHASPYGTKKLTAAAQGMPANREHGPSHQERRRLLQSISALCFDDGPALGTLSHAMRDLELFDRRFKCLPDVVELLVVVSPDLGELLLELADSPQSRALKRLKRPRAGVTQAPLPADPQALTVEVYIVRGCGGVTEEGPNRHRPAGRPAYDDGAQGPARFDRGDLDEGQPGLARRLSQTPHWKVGGGERQEEQDRDTRLGHPCQLVRQDVRRRVDRDQNDVARGWISTALQIGDRSGLPNVSQILGVRIDTNEAPGAPIAFRELSHQHQAILRKTWKPAALSRNR